MTENGAPEEAVSQDEQDAYESPEIVVLGRVEDLTLGIAGVGADAGLAASIIIF